MPIADTYFPKTVEEHYTDCYLLLAKLARALLNRGDEDETELAVEAIAYLVEHCSFCGRESDLTMLKNSVLPVIVCRECCRSPLIGLKSAGRVLRDPNLKALMPLAKPEADPAVEEKPARQGPKLYLVK